MAEDTVSRARRAFSRAACREPEMEVRQSLFHASSWIIDRTL